MYPSLQTAPGGAETQDNGGSSYVWCHRPQGSLHHSQYRRETTRRAEETSPIQIRLQVQPEPWNSVRPDNDVPASDPRQFFLPDSDEGEPDANVEEVRVSDRGSLPQMVRVVVAGVPVEGVVNTAADITIIGAEAFKPITSVAKLKRRDFKPVDKTLHT